MSFRDKLKCLERLIEGDMLNIPQRDGTVAHFPESELGPAYLVALDRELGRSTEDHPLCQAARNSSDPKWRDSVWSGPEEVLEEVEDLSEP